MMSEKKVKVHIVLSKDLLVEIREVVGAKKRSDFLAEAASEKLKRLRLESALHKTAGLWREERYPEFKTEKTVRSHIRVFRKRAGKRVKAKVHANQLPS
mgnify:CR=1 FL=1